MSDLTMLQLMGLAGMEDGTDLDAIAEGASVVEDLPTTKEEIETTTAEASLAETNEEVQELSTDVQAVAEAVVKQEEVIEELKEDVAGIEGLLSSASYSAPALAILYARAAKNNTKAGGAIIPALGAEALADPATAAMATRAGLEGFGETIKNYANAAIAYIKKLWDSLLAFIVGLFNRIAGIRRLAESLLKRAKSDSFKEKKEITLGKWNNYVDIQGKTAKFTEHAEKVGKVCVALGELCNDTKQLSNSVKDDKDSVGGLAAKYEKLTSQLIAAISAAQNKKEQKKLDRFSTVATMGNVQVLVTYHDKVPTKIGELTKALNETRFSSKVVGAKNVKVEGKIKPKWGQNELIAKCNEVLDGLKKLELLKASKEFSNSTRDHVIAEMKIVAAQDSSIASKAISCTKALFAMSNSINTVMLNLALAEAQGTLGAVKAHL